MQRARRRIQRGARRAVQPDTAPAKENERGAWETELSTNDHTFFQSKRRSGSAEIETEKDSEIGERIGKEKEEEGIEKEEGKTGKRTTVDSAESDAD